MSFRIDRSCRTRSRLILLWLLFLLAVIEAHTEVIVKRQAPTTIYPSDPDPSDVGAGGYDPDPYDQNPTNVDPNCAAVGEGYGCTKQTPPGGLTYGRCCYTSGQDPQYIYCRTHWWYPSVWRAALCYQGNCIQIDAKNDYMVCGYTS